MYRAMTIYLSRGLEALVSEVDYEALVRFRWTGEPRAAHRAYAYRMFGRKKVYMHRQIVGLAFTETDLVVDHIDRDGLNNTRSNLRTVPNAVNRQNAAYLVGMSGHRGVRIRGGRYQARIWHSGREISLGCFGTAVEAAEAYDAKALELYGPFAYVNFRSPAGLGEVPSFEIDDSPPF